MPDVLGLGAAPPEPLAVGVVGWSPSPNRLARQRAIASLVTTGWLIRVGPVELLVLVGLQDLVSLSAQGPSNAVRQRASGSLQSTR